MSVDLLLDTVRPIHVREFVPKISATLADLLSLAVKPILTLRELGEGTAQITENDEIGINSSPVLLLSVFGESNSVMLGGGADYVSISVSGGYRTELQYALAAATAITLARECRCGFSDDRRVFSDQAYTTPDALFEQLRVIGPNTDARTAAAKIAWGPGF